jgi:hypothetical protein
MLLFQLLPRAAVKVRHAMYAQEEDGEDELVVMIGDGMAEGALDGTAFTSAADDSPASSNLEPLVVHFPSLECSIAASIAALTHFACTAVVSSTDEESESLDEAGGKEGNACGVLIGDRGRDTVFLPPLLLHTLDASIKCMLLVGDVDGTETGQRNANGASREASGQLRMPVDGDQLRLAAADGLVEGLYACWSTQEGRLANVVTCGLSAGQSGPRCMMESVLFDRLAQMDRPWHTISHLQRPAVLLALAAAEARATAHGLLRPRHS